MKIPRIYQNLANYLKPGQVLVIYGPRQVGKTTLLQDFLVRTKFKYKLDSGDNLRVSEILGSQDFKTITDYVSGYELLAIDEAQGIPGIGQILKIIVDQAPHLRVIVTGSSSFELSGQIGEPLTGRKQTLTLFPIAQIELAQIMNAFELKEQLPEWLVFGSYPKVITATNRADKISQLDELAHAYLFKDILELDKVKSPKLLIDLLRLLAFQLGHEVSWSELGQNLGMDYKTVGRYLDLLEKSFVIYNLRGFSRNLRKEITKKSKYYFFDLGIRNALIANFNDLSLRDDTGQLWENFLVIERLKKQHYTGLHANNYFWRTWDQKELDWLEERAGTIYPYEFKYQETKYKLPAEFWQTYPKAEKGELVNRENYLSFIV